MAEYLILFNEEWVPDLTEEDLRDVSRGPPLVTDGPFAETKAHLGGFAVIDVADEEAARLWAEKIAVACGWPQEVRRFRYAADPSGEQ